MALKQQSTAFLWTVALLSTLVIAAGVVGGWGAAKFYLGEPAVGRVIEFHHTSSSSRNASIVGEVDVAMPDGSKFRDEIDDAMGSQDWAVGGNVSLRCARFHDHWNCSADSGLSGFVPPLLLLGIGVGMVLWSATKIRSRRAKNPPR